MSYIPSYLPNSRTLLGVGVGVGGMDRGTLLACEYRADRHPHGKASGWLVANSVCQLHGLCIDFPHPKPGFTCHKRLRSRTNLNPYQVLLSLQLPIFRFHQRTPGGKSRVMEPCCGGYTHFSSYGQTLILRETRENSHRH